MDTFRTRFSNRKNGLGEHMEFVSTSFGEIRVFDSGGSKPVMLNIPDGPNVIEHQLELIKVLSKNFRVVCMELPGVGFSYPTSKYDYSINQAAELIIEVLDEKSIDRFTFTASCGNGFYAIRLAQKYPERVSHLFLAQTPSIGAMDKWTEKSIPKLLMKPVIGQIANALGEKKFASIWYKYALPKGADKAPFTKTAVDSLNRGGCFCLSSLVQGFQQERHRPLVMNGVLATLVYGSSDFTHRKTDFNSIHEHVPNCEVIEFSGCGHFPELENVSDFARLVNERQTN